MDTPLLYTRKILPLPILSCDFCRKLLPVIVHAIVPAMLLFGASQSFASGIKSASKLAAAEPTAAAEGEPSAAAEPAAAPSAKAPLKAVDANTNTLDPNGDSEEHEAAKPVVRSARSLFLENRLSLGTSLGWSKIRPYEGTWEGLGTSDISFQWRLQQEATGHIFLTGRYAPFTGVWTYKHEDYNATLHGFYGGAEFRTPVGTKTVRAGAELGYMLIYARAQDKSKVPSSVTSGKINLSAGGGVDWGFASNKVQVGPFARIHIVGFSIFTGGASARFVF